MNSDQPLAWSVILGDESIAPALTSGLFLRPSLSVKTSHFDIQAVLAREGVIALRHHPDLVGPIRWLVRRGDLHPVLPGVSAPRLDVDTFDTRISALMAWEPNAILVGAN